MSYEGPLKIGLTGSIGMGKSTITKQLRRLGFPVFDADEAVHTLYSPGGKAVEPLRNLFPLAIIDNGVSRKALMEEILANSEAIKDIERIVHPLVIQERNEFTQQARERGEFMVFFDIPLLFENRREHIVDYIVVISADAETQRQRVLSRTGMTEEKFLSIMKKQVPDEEKRRQADFVVETHYPGFSEGRAQLARIIQSIMDKEHLRWQAWKLHQRELFSTREPLRALGSSTTDANNGIRRHIDAIVFDLDDTLVPTQPPIMAAIQALQGFAAEYMPQTSRVLMSRMKEVIGHTMEQYPLVAHDVTELRRRGLYSLASEFGEEQHVDAAMNVLVDIRSNVAPYLYPDVILFLDWMQREGLKIGILTNGNGDVNRCESLQKYGILNLAAPDIGIAKPSPLGFLTFCQTWRIPPHRILFVGDDHKKDIEGAQMVGMKTALIDRERPFNPAELEADLARFPAANLLLHHLDIKEFVQKMDKHFHES
jgi:dephospho-CoA kinase